MDYWPANATIIQVDINPDWIGLTKKVTVGIVGDTAKVATVSWFTPEDDAATQAKERRKIAFKNQLWRRSRLTDHEQDDPAHLNDVP